MVGAESIQLKLNYYALTVAILRECTPETAFEKLQSDHPEKAKAMFTKEDLEDMRKILAEGVSWRELARIYCVPTTTVYGRLRLRKGKVS